jgi:hypothetical protein
MWQCYMEKRRDYACDETDDPADDLTIGQDCNLSTTHFLNTGLNSSEH